MRTNPRLRAPLRAPRRAGLVVACLVVASLLVTAPAGASRLEAARQRLASLVKQIKQTEAAIAAEHQHLDALAAQLTKVQADLQATQAKLVSTQQHLADTLAKYQELQGRLAGVARTAYEQGPLAPMEAVLGATSFGDLMDRLEYLDRVQSSNAAIVNEVANQAARLSFVRHDLNVLSSKQASQSVQLQSQRAALLSGLLDQQRQLADLSVQRRKAARLVRLLSLPPDPGITGAGVPFGHWAALLLSKIGAPACQQNLTVVVAWEVAEGTAAAYNPLATTYYWPGSTVFNYASVRNYPSLAVGLEATVATLRTGASSHGYGAILADLGGCAPSETTATAINASDWCRGCVGGLYVLSVLPLVEADYARFAGE